MNPAQVGVSHGGRGAGGERGGEGSRRGQSFLTLSGADVSDQPKPKSSGLKESHWILFKMQILGPAPKDSDSEGQVAG